MADRADYLPKKQLRTEFKKQAEPLTHENFSRYEKFMRAAISERTGNGFRM